MSKKRKKQRKTGDPSQKISHSSGLGRSLNELLEDNSELTNMECKVLLNRDGESLKIYNKVGGKNSPGGESSHKISRNSPSILPKEQSYPTKVQDDASTVASRETKNDNASKALDSLDDYRHPAKDEFLEAVLDVSNEYRPKEYKTDKDGRIIIDPAGKSKIKIR